MTRVQVDSSAIESVEYVKKKKDLDVQFTDGTSRVYHNLPEKIYQEFLLAKSKGRYFNYNIRDIYPYS